MGKKKGMIKVDFTGVEAGQAGKLLPEGPTKFEVVDIEEKEGESSGKPYQEITLAVLDGEENEGTKAWDNMSMQPQALWKFRGFLDALGIATEDGEMDLDPDDIIGKTVIAEIIHEEYQGKTKHRIASYTPIDGEPAEPEAPASTVKRKKAGGGDEPAAFKLKAKVTFMDGKKKLAGVVSAIDDDKITVKVTGTGKATDGEYEMSADDLTAA